MFFNSRKYTEETEHNRIKQSQDPSMFNLISLGILASFPPSRFFSYDYTLIKSHRIPIIKLNPALANKLQFYISMVFEVETIQLEY